MLKAIGYLIKLTVFSVLVLVLGNWLRWDGKSISDQIKTRMAHAEKENILNTVQDTVRGWAEKVTHDARKGYRKKLEQPTAIAPQEEISSSERQKLKALIRELNSSHKKD